MKTLALAFGLLAVASTSPAHAMDDYSVVQFNDGFCRIWWDSSGVPWGAGWTKIAIGLPDHVAAQAALNTAISQGICR
jgi:hypothetical protein